MKERMHEVNSWKKWWTNKRLSRGILTLRVHVLVSPSVACTRTVPCRGYLLSPTCVHTARERPVHAYKHRYAFSVHTTITNVFLHTFPYCHWLYLHMTYNHWLQSFSWCSRLEFSNSPPWHQTSLSKFRQCLHILFLWSLSMAFHSHLVSAQRPTILDTKKLFLLLSCDQISSTFGSSYHGMTLKRIWKVLVWSNRMQRSKTNEKSKAKRLHTPAKQLL